MRKCIDHNGQKLTVVECDDTDMVCLTDDKKTVYRFARKYYEPYRKLNEVFTRKTVTDCPAAKAR